VNSEKPINQGCPFAAWYLSLDRYIYLQSGTTLE
jgi:hypothetical protein